MVETILAALVAAIGTGIAAYFAHRSSIKKTDTDREIAEKAAYRQFILDYEGRVQFWKEEVVAVREEAERDLKDLARRLVDKYEYEMEQLRRHYQQELNNLRGRIDKVERNQNGGQ